MVDNKNLEENNENSTMKNNDAISIAIPKKKLIYVGIIIILFIIVIAGMAIHEKKALKKQLDEIGITQDGTELIMPSNEVEISVSTLREVIAPAKELISYKYYYTDAGVYEKNKTFFSTSVGIPFTKNQQVYVYSGTIGVGLNIEDISFDINEDNKRITVKMPELGVIYHTFDTSSFQSYDVKSSIITKINLSDYADFEEELKQHQEEKLSAYDEFWKEARKNTEATLDGLLSVSGLVDDYVIQYEWQ